jgi:protein SCO1/2
MLARAVRNAIAGNKGPWVALAGLAVVALGVALWLLARPQEPQAQFVEVADGAYILPRPDPVANFSLVTQDDTAFDNAALEGKWSFLFFGFTHCPDLCPTTLAVFDQVQRLLVQSQAGAADVQFVFVSVDPQRDTPQMLKEYVAAINPTFVGVTGNDADLAALADSLGVVYAKVAGSSPEQYFMDHSSAVLLINPAGRFNGVFAAPHDAHKIAAGYLEIRKRSR